MDVKLDSAVIRSERRKRAWSQEELAAVAGVGVRTIQRIESSGVASSESAKCLAAVFELPVARLLVDERKLPGLRARHWAAGTAACLALASSLFPMPRANATDVAMVVVINGISGQSRMSFEVGNDRQTEIKLEKDLRLLLTPTIQKDGNILLAAELYGWDGVDFKLAGKPRLLMRQGTETGLQLNVGGARTVGIRITAREM